MSQASSKRERAQRVCVLAIGGLDPGGGAGILVDARAMAHAGVFACAATALLTVQSTSGLRSAKPVATRELVAACTEVLRMQRVAAIKVGALGSQENARAVGNLLARHREIPSVVDTVLLPTRGRARLLPEGALSTLRRGVIRHATLVTANAPEAEAITGLRVTRLDEARAAADAILALGPRSVLIKGGHLSGKDATDLLALRRTEGGVRVVLLRAPRLRLGPTHGGGCALASLIAARLALGNEMESALRWAKRAHHSALQNALDVGGEMRVLFG